MTIEVRRADSIHREEGGWFSARWHFSFDRYRDPERMGIGPLRVFNDDRLVPGAVWPLHPHRDVEGITYVPEGRFRHQDSLGNGGEFDAPAVQRMTLGRGARHSEQNGSETEPMRFIQLWILPDTPDLEPEVEQRQYRWEDMDGHLLRVLGPEGGEVVKVHQDASMYVGRLRRGEEAGHEFADARAGYLYVMHGTARIDGDTLAAGDAAAIDGLHRLRIEGAGDVEPAHIILVDVPRQYEPVGVWSRMA